MLHHLEPILGGPWVLLIVFLLAGLDAVLPFTPSETTLVAAGAVAAGVGHPPPPALIAAGAAGAFLGDHIAYLLGRRIPAARIGRRRHTSAARRWAAGLMTHRGGLAIMFARYLPGGRSLTAVTAGLVGYPARRFRRYTGMAVLLWSAQAVMLGYLGGVAFAHRPLLGVATGCAAGTVILLVVSALHRRTVRRADRRAADPAVVAAAPARGSPPA